MDELQDIVKELKREYQREWRAKNKDKVQAINNRYWIKKALQEQQRRDDEWMF